MTPRAPRVDYVVQVDVGGYNHFFTGFSGEVRNVSKGGLFIATEGEPPAVGTRFKVSFVLPPSVPIEGQVEVRWRRPKPQGDLPPGVGVMFLDLTPEAEEAINKFIQENSGTIGFFPDPGE